MNKLFVPIILLIAVTGVFGRENPSGKWSHDISGTWKIMRGNSQSFARPDYDDSHWPEVELPSKYLMPSETDHLFPSEDMESPKIYKGFVWYRKTLNISSVPSQDLTLQIKEIMNADRVFINGALVGNSGKFPPGFRSAWSRFRSYPVPRLLLNAGKNTIAIQVYFDSEAWILGPMSLVDSYSGNRKKMIMDILLNHMMQGFSFILILISFLFFMLYFRRNSEHHFLLFAVSTLMLSLLISLQYLENFYSTLPLSSNTIFKITQTGMIWFPPCLALFFRAFVHQDINKRRVIPYLSLALLFWVMMIFSIERHNILMWRNISIIMIPFFSFDIIYVSLSQLLKKNRRGILIFSGMLPIILLGFHDVLAFPLEIIETGTPLFVFGIPIFLIIIATYLVNQFITSLNHAEELNLSLQQSLIEKERLLLLEQELTVARGLQLSSVPKELPSPSSFKVGVLFRPMEKIGGDFFNFSEIDDNHIGVLIADVSGHGIPAALIAAMGQVAFNVLTHLAQEPVRLILEMNNILEKLIKDHFLTAGYVYLDKTSECLTYVRAGHEPLLIYRRSRAIIETILPRGRAIGLSNEFFAEAERISIEKGDRIILYTDCITETFNDKKEMYGTENFISFIKSHDDLNPEEFPKALLGELERWNKEGSQFNDDLTLIVIDVL